MLTKKEAVSNFRMMWHRMAEKSRKEKRRVRKDEVIEELWGDIDIRSDCWCCEYVGQFDIGCTHCSIKWKNDCDCASSEYGEWRNAFFKGDWEKAAEWADVIAELPEREDV